MEIQRVISQELFDELVHDAIQDLFKTGLSRDEICLIIQEQFGQPYARRYCGNP